jgi:hypothetical protein
MTVGQSHKARKQKDYNSYPDNQAPKFKPPFTVLKLLHCIMCLFLFHINWMLTMSEPHKSSTFCVLLFHWNMLLHVHRKLHRKLFSPSRFAHHGLNFEPWSQPQHWASLVEIKPSASQPNPSDFGLKAKNTLLRCQRKHTYITKSF